MQTTVGSPTTATAVEISIVIATYNRGRLLCRTLEGLAAQSISPDRFEVVVVDDGSERPAEEVIAGCQVPYRLTVIRQANAGPAAARDRGIREARAPIVLLIDDDMGVPPSLVRAHLQAHQDGVEVGLGRILGPWNPRHLPLFERFHLRHIAAYGDAIQSGRIPVRGVHLCTGNVSMRRELYLRAGGFDPRLMRSEDRDLGIRLERMGAKLAYVPEAATVHNTDHTDLSVWLRRAHAYGLWDSVISDKYPDLEIANPWRFFHRVHPISRPLLFVSGVEPALAHWACPRIMHLAERLDQSGLEGPALAATTLVYGLAYFAGVRTSAGSLGAYLGGLRSYRADRSVLRRAGRRFVASVQADHASVQRYRARYHGEHISGGDLPIHLVTKIGLQMCAAIRLMQLAGDLGLPAVAQIISRTIRHAYGAEIHWDAEIAPGISIVHGTGLVIGKNARVGPGCILFHEVTLGEGIDPESRATGAPHLTEDVHVGPGAKLLGPITVGAGSKVMAGAVLNRSVPPGSVVQTPQPVVTQRRTGGPSVADGEVAA